jgi:hypothetical protein
MSIEVFLSTLLGAFLGVSLPFLIADLRARRAFETALDAIFAESEAYVQGVRARRNFLMQDAQRSWSQFKAQQSRMVANNVRDPTDIAGVLISQYAQYLRPADVFLLRQSQENLAVLLSGLRSFEFASPANLDERLDALIENAARRSWLIWNVATRSDHKFSQSSYNELIQALNAVPSKRLKLVTKPAPGVDEGKE